MFSVVSVVYSFVLITTLLFTSLFLDMLLSYSDCPFYVRVAFDRLVSAYIVKRCRSSHMGHAVNLSSIVGHVRFEADLSIDERSQLANFGKIGYTD